MSHIHNEFIEVQRTQRKYIVTFGYTAEGVNENVSKLFENKEHDASQTMVEVESSDLVSAIALASKIHQADRSIDMLDFIAKYGTKDKENWSIEEIDAVLQNGLSEGFFQEWILMEPTTIQVCLSDDLDNLRNMTIKAINSDINNISSDAEKYLKEREA